MASVTANRFKLGGTLSGSTDGKAFKVAGTNFAGADTLHTATNTAGEVDYITLWAENIDTSNDIPLYLLFGDESTGDETPILIPKANDANGETTFPVAPNKVLIADHVPVAGGDTVKAFAGTTNKIKITGKFQRWETVA